MSEQSTVRLANRAQLPVAPVYPGCDGAAACVAYNRVQQP